MDLRMKLVAVCGAAAALGGVGGGCGYYGDSTPGEENRSEWRIDDGLCPGTEGGCDMGVPTALGSVVAVDGDVFCAHPRRDSSTGRTVVDCDIDDFSVTVDGAGDDRSLSRDASAGRIDLEVDTIDVGDVTLSLTRDGSSFDRARFEVREAARMECGEVGSSGASWDMRGLRMSSSFSFETVGADRVTDAELGCRLLDAAGAPLLSGSAIEWTIIDGADIATIDDGGLFGDDATSGARVYVRFDGRGTIVVEARFMGMTSQIELVVN
ncbi:MAG: hypothetical protein AB7S26_22590 [Sandaracinaceae bacterium]